MTVAQATRQVLDLLDETNPRPELTDRLPRFFDRGQKEIALYCPIWRYAPYGPNDARTLPEDCRLPRYVQIAGQLHPWAGWEGAGPRFVLWYEAKAPDVPQNDPSATFALPDRAMPALVLYAAAETQAMEHDQRYFQSFFARYQAELANLTASFPGPVGLVTGGAHV